MPQTSLLGEAPGSCCSVFKGNPTATPFFRLHGYEFFYGWGTLEPLDIKISSWPPGAPGIRIHIGIERNRCHPKKVQPIRSACHSRFDVEFPFKKGLLLNSELGAAQPIEAHLEFVVYFVGTLSVFS